MTMTRIDMTNIVNIDTFPQVRAGCGSFNELPKVIYRTLAGSLSATGEMTAFLLTDAGVAQTGIVDRAAEILTSAGISAVVYKEIPANPSTESLDLAAQAIRSVEANVLVAIGGGSVLDAAKGVGILARNSTTAREFTQRGMPGTPALPIVAVPTTAGTGAETNGFGVIEDQTVRSKLYISDESAVPKAVILDPELTVGVPPPVTAATGFDALIHGIESLTSRGANPVSVAYAAQAIEMVSGALPAAVADGTDLEARAQMLWAAHLAGRALSISGLGIIHGLSHAITALSGAPHGVALASVAQAVLTDQEARHPELYAHVTRSLVKLSTSGSDGVAARVGLLVRQIDLEPKLSELGISADMIAAVVDKALNDPVTVNTATIPSREDLLSMLQGLL